MEKLEFKKAEQGDVESICEMDKKLIRQYEDPTVVDLHRALAWTRTKIEGNYEAYTCVWKDGVKAGYYHLIPQPDLRLELDDVLILPAFRGQGIGTAVLQKIIAEADEPIYLYVFQKNTRAVSLYEKMGFAVTKIISPTRMIMEYRK